MLDAATNHECATRANVERFSLAGNPEMAMHYINNLIVRMAVHGTGPTLHHFVLSEKKLVVVGEHAPFQPALRRGLLAILVGYH